MVAVFSICLPISAQLNTGRISGQVTDQTGGVIAGATVSVTDVARGQTRPLTTDSAGAYAAPNLLPGTYTVHIESQGFQALDRQNVVVTAGSDIRVDATLQPGATTQTVTVTEALPIVNTTNAETGGTLDNNLISNLPMNGRNYRWQYQLAIPGVVVGVGEGSSDQFVNGSPVSNGFWNFLFDGLYSETFFTLEVGAGGTGEGGDTTLMPLDAIQEVAVIINPKAEFGWAPGITQDIALKSGTNNMHGSAYAFGRDTSFDARNPFAPPSFGATPVNFEQFGATLGGPIKKDKLFYFVGYEGERLSTASNFTTAIPTTATLGGNPTVSIPDAIAAMNGAGHAVNPLSASLSGCNPGNPNFSNTSGATVALACTANALGAPGLWNNNTANASGTESFAFPEAGGSDNGLFKLDYHINDHHSINGSLFIGRYAENVVPNGSQDFTQSYYEELTKVESDMGRLVWIWTPNASWLNQARVGIDHGNRPVFRQECLGGTGASNASGVGATGGTNGGPNYLTQYGLLSGAPGCGLPTITIQGFTGQLGFANNRVDWENPIQGADSVSYTRGTHQFKFGADIRAENFYGAKVLDSQSGTAAFGGSGFAAFPGATPLESFLAGAVDNETIRPTTDIRHITTNKIAFFVQDDWRVKPKLTLNLGLRWESDSPLKDANGLIGNFAPGTPSGMVQTGEIFKFQQFWEPRLGLAYDLTGKGTTVIRAGGGVMYMIPMGMNYVSGGNTIDVGGEPTGALLFAANGSSIQGPGTITSAQITPTALTTTGVITTPLPWALSTSATGPGANPIFPSLVAQCGNGAVPVGGGPGAPAINPAQCLGQGFNPNLKLFPFWSWNLDVQHAFTNNVSLDVGYVGSRSYNLINTYNLNQPNPGSNSRGAELNREPWNLAANNSYNVAYPWFSTIYYLANGGGSNYAGLQVQLTVRNIHGLTLTGNYTFSHALLQTLDYGFNTMTDGNNPLDATQHYTMTASYAIPGIKAPGQMLRGWAINASLNVLSGLPVAATDTSDDVAGFGSRVADRWNLYGPATPFNGVLGAQTPIPCYGVVGSKFTPASNPTSNGCQPVAAVASMPAPCLAAATAAGTSPTVPSSTGMTQLAAIGCYVEGNSALVAPPQGTEGNMYPSELRGQGATLLNASVTKDWKIKERYTTQFRFELFNALNDTIYSQYSLTANLGAPATFGIARATPDVAHGNAVVGSGGPREIRLALKFLW